MARVCIIGAGIIGLSCAYACAIEGHHVTVIDRGPERRDGCSFGNAGMVVPSHFTPLAAPGMVALGLKWMWNPESPFWIRPRVDWELARWGFHFWRAATYERVRQAAPLLRDLSLASRTAFQQLARDLEPGFGLTEQGLLMLCKTQKALDEERETVARAHDLGLAAELLDARQTAQLDPGVNMSVVGSVYFPQDCHLSPSRLMDGLQGRISRMGGTWHWGEEVTRIESSGTTISAVVTPQSRVEVDELVVCGGSWSPGLASGLGIRLPLQPGKGYSLTLQNPRQLPQKCAIFHEARVAVTPMGSTLRIGGTMEVGGLNSQIDPRRVRGIIRSVPLYYPGFQESDFTDIRPWFGLRPCSPDGLPYLGRPRKYRNLVIATGHAMMGLSLGPISGQLVAELINGRKPSMNLSLLSPDRYN